MVLTSLLPVRPKDAVEAHRLTLRVLDELMDTVPARETNVGLRLWDGTMWPDEAPRLATVVLKHPGALRAMFLPGNEVGLAEAYLRDDFDIEGDIESIFAFGEMLGKARLNVLQRLRVLVDLLHLPDDDLSSNGHSAPDGCEDELITDGDSADGLWVADNNGYADGDDSFELADSHSNGHLNNHSNGYHALTRKAAHLNGKRHSIERDSQAVAYHYNASNEFYALWLDKRMVYSCAYFESSTDSLDTAQSHKLDYLCKKLRLKPGQKVLDIGCGWGGLIMHAAKNYGVDITGITLSEPQARLANERIEAAGLQDNCRALIRDYREMEGAGTFDAIVSVGMFEHVGAAMMPVYMRQAFNLLKPRGVFLNHGIAYNAVNQLEAGPSFIENYVFPDGELLPINATLRECEQAGFEVRDVESLREHYKLTTRRWLHRLEERHREALQAVDEATYRTWRLYLAGSAYGFNLGRLNLYQTLLVKADNAGHSGLPLTRAGWYTGQWPS